MNRTQKFAANSFAAALSQIVVMIAGFITPRIMIATYGSELNGLVSSLSQFISYISLVEAGLGGASIFSLYKPLAQNDHKHISRILSATRKSYSQAGYIFSSGIFALAILFGFLRSTDTLSFQTILFLTLLLGVNGSLDFFLLSGYRVLLTADQKNYVLSSLGIMQTVLRTLIIFTLATVETNIVLLYAVALLPAFIKAYVLLRYGKKTYPYVENDAKPDYEALKKRWDVIYQQILGTVQTGAPTVLATVLTDFFTVSVYSVYNMVLSGINGVLNIFITGLPAGFGELIAKGETKTLRKAVSEFECGYYYVLSLIYGLLFVLILPFITIYTQGFTDTNYIIPALAFVIVLNGLLYNIKTPQSMLIISAGMYRETRLSVTLQGLSIAVFGILFGRLYGITGIMIGSCISNLYRTVDLLFFVPKRITGLSVRTSVLRMLRVGLNILLIVLPAAFIDIQPSGYFAWLLYAVGFGLYALFVVTLTSWIFDKGDFMELAHRLAHMIKREKPNDQTS